MGLPKKAAAVYNTMYLYLDLSRSHQYLLWIW